MSTPDATDPDRIGSSLRNLAEAILPCLDAVGAQVVVELGASHGDFTGELLGWAAGGSASVVAVDPTPAPELLALAERHPGLELVSETSHEALRHLERPDAIIIDGDHNYYTVSEDLRLIAELGAGAQMPLVMLHDLGWPHGRRDAYYAPERIPEERRQPLAHHVYLAPENPGVGERGILVEWTAEREGGPRNGVRTAVEDFVEGHEGVRLAVFPAFFGLGVVWHGEAPWSGAISRAVEPWDGNPLIERLEQNRLLKLVQWASCFQSLEFAERRLERMARQEEVLRAMVESRAFAWGERLSRLHGRGRPAFSREQVRRALGDASDQD